MGQPVKLSDELVSDARNVAELTQRSIAGQIEFWAAIGKSLEPLLRGDRMLALRQSGATRPLHELITEVDTGTGRGRVRELLNRQPFPHYRVAEGQPGLLCRTDEDGTETIGRFVGREFMSVETARMNSGPHWHMIPSAPASIASKPARTASSTVATLVSPMQNVMNVLDAAFRIAMALAG